MSTIPSTVSFGAGLLWYRRQLVLSPIVVKCTQNYIARMLKGEDVKPMLSVFEDVQAEQEKICKSDI